MRGSEAFEKTYIALDSRAFELWGEYLEIGWYGALLECLTWWNLHICFMFSGYLGVTETAAQVAIMQIKNFTTMIPQGVSFTASGLVGICIGKDQVGRAQSFELVCIVYSILVTCVMLSGFAVFADPLARLFTKSDNVAETTKASFWSLFLYILFSTVKGV